jgi:hypothetical protein
MHAPEGIHLNVEKLHAFQRPQLAQTRLCARHSTLERFRPLKPLYIILNVRTDQTCEAEMENTSSR